MQLHLNEDGMQIDPDQRQSYFHVAQIERRLLPVIPTPYNPSPDGLVNLWRAIEVATQHNAPAALFTFGAVAMNMHFQTLVELKGGAPVVVLYGEPDVGKTTVSNAAMSVLGIEACSFRGLRREFFIHLASQTSLGLLYDDPNKLNEVENVIVDFYNGMTRGGFKRGLETPILFPMWFSACMQLHFGNHTEVYYHDQQWFLLYNAAGCFLEWLLYHFWVLEYRPTLLSNREHFLI